VFAAESIGASIAPANIKSNILRALLAAEFGKVAVLVLLSAGSAHPYVSRFGRPLFRLKGALSIECCL
jgi:hypothetical protein